jgi:catechol 2,3-dioxygenase-like lactoylglutathione lyase family enzyme/limonene-1,2-epoxide hydrolase
VSGRRTAARLRQTATVSDAAAVVREHVRAFNAGELDAVLRGVSADCRWVSGETVVVGRAALAEFFGAAIDGIAPRLAVRSVVAAGGSAAAELTETITYQGQEREFAIGGFYRVEAGRIAAATIYRAGTAEVVPPGTVHHVELWMPDLARAERSWGWLLPALGYAEYQRWADGVSYRLGPTYVVLERSAALEPGPHRRRAAGTNHLAFHAGGRSDVDGLVAAAPAHGWALLFADRHPHAGGAEHYAAYLEDADGYEVELVAA